MNKFIVKTSSAKMPATCWGKYKHVAVIETDGLQYPKMISERAKGVVRIVKVWEKCFVGKTNKCSYNIALHEASKLINILNKETI